MHYINGVRQSPFPHGHWTDGLSQQQIVANLIETGAAFKYVEMLAKESMEKDHLRAVNRSVFWENHARLDDYLPYDSGTTLVLWIYVLKQPKLITFQAGEVGSLIRFNHFDPEDDGVIPVDVLLEESSKMELNNAQINELAMLLNKVGYPVDFPVPSVPEATEAEKIAVLNRYGLDYIAKKPRRSHNEFMREMLTAGTPVSMTYKEFHEYAQKVLKP